MYDVFSLPDYLFPPGFVWGSATAGHQIEGDNIHSNWWEWEQTAPWVKKPSGKACNSWQLFEQDVDLLSSLGHRMFRMSLVGCLDQQGVQVPGAHQRLLKIAEFDLEHGPLCHR